MRGDAGSVGRPCACTGSGTGAGAGALADTATLVFFLDAMDGGLGGKLTECQLLRQCTHKSNVHKKGANTRKVVQIHEKLSKYTGTCPCTQAPPPPTLVVHENLSVYTKSSYNHRYGRSTVYRRQGSWIHLSVGFILESKTSNP